MTDDEFDAALVKTAFAMGAAQGWGQVSAAAAARDGGLDLARARERFTKPGAILRSFGKMADEYALTGALTDGTVKDRLFDILLRRIDFLQMHRAGVIALLRALPLDAPLAAWMGRESVASMGWMLEGAGVSARGLRGALRKKGLAAVWAWGVRAWMRDESEDLSATMAAFDVALARAEQIAMQFGGAGPAEGFTPETETPATEISEPELPLEP
jgi:hypothetical protein